ncbi:hypothetical protein [uncultured Duncaniella sp.]|uniref:hypothetical protein n=1 Tax=uncultured Duncaniella sp. TaxID=2768039 RepID=UPI002657CAEA|nr:hypothetical protein [uncultured Duncaniella sp.]
MKKKFIHKKKVSWRKTLLVLQVIVLSPVLLSLIAINWLSDWLLTKWGAYRTWFMSKRH